MKKSWLVIACSTITLIFGFVIGFFNGETVYIWVFRPFHEDMSVAWTALVGVGTLALAGVSIWQTNRANKISEKLMNIDIESKKTNFSYLIIKNAKMCFAQNLVINNDKTYRASNDIVLSVNNTTTVEQSAVDEKLLGRGFSVDLYADSERDFLISEVEIHGIRVDLFQKDRSFETVWFSNDHTAKPIKLKISNATGNEENSSHYLRINFELKTPINLYPDGTNMDIRGMRITFTKIRYRNVLDIVTECFQIIELSRREDNNVDNHCHLNYGVQKTCRIDKVSYNPILEGLE